MPHSKLVNGQRILLTADEIAAIPQGPTGAEVLAEWRAGAKVTQSQVRLALRQLGLLATVQAMADADPDAAIVWEYATEISRNSPFISALQTDAFTETQIDDIFVYAQGISV